MPDIRIGQVWRDLDVRSDYDVTPSGLPIAEDYVGPIAMKQRPRLVEVIGPIDERVRVRSIHNQRESTVKRSFFHDSETNSRGLCRRQGFVLVHDVSTVQQAHDARLWKNPKEDPK